MGAGHLLPLTKDHITSAGGTCHTWGLVRRETPSAEPIL